MTHYTTESQAATSDWQTTQLVTTGDVERMAARIQANDIPFCGHAAVMTTMLFAEQCGASASLLGYATSARATHDTSRVVGYGAFAFSKTYAPDPLTAQDRTDLLSVARNMLVAAATKKGIALQAAKSDRLRLHQGAFVTLTENGNLRGCIGYRTDAQELYQSVAEAAKFAASRDPRFDAVQDSELSKINIEISAIGDLHRVRGVDEITIGQDGLYIRNGNKSGLLLPQVAKENNWSLQEYLKQVCVKAELDPAVLSQPGTELYRFNAEVFRE
jgi:AmmeMemoRadiSam system protein A